MANLRGGKHVILNTEENWIPWSWFVLNKWISRDRRHVSLRQIRFLLRNFFFSFPFFLSSSKFNYSSVHFTIPLTRIIPRKYFFFSLSFFFSFHNRLQSFQNINFKEIKIYRRTRVYRLSPWWMKDRRGKEERRRKFGKEMKNWRSKRPARQFFPTVLVTYLSI